MPASFKHIFAHTPPKLWWSPTILWHTWCINTPHSTPSTIKITLHTEPSTAKYKLQASHHPSPHMGVNPLAQPFPGVIGFAHCHLYSESSSYSVASSNWECCCCSCSSAEAPCLLLTLARLAPLVAREGRARALSFRSRHSTRPRSNANRRDRTNNDNSTIFNFVPIRVFSIEFIATTLYSGRGICPKQYTIMHKAFLTFSFQKVS